MKQNLTTGDQNICHLTGLCVCVCECAHRYTGILKFILYIYYNMAQCVRQTVFHVKSWNQFTIRARSVLLSLGTPKSEKSIYVLICSKRKTAAPKEKERK